MRDFVLKDLRFYYRSEKSSIYHLSYQFFYWPVNSRVPACSQGEVDDHIHRDQVSHCIIVGSHGAQDPLSSLIQDNTVRVQLKKTKKL